MKFPRASGVLLHPTSLPGPFGIGDLGPQASAFADFLSETGMKIWQILPLSPTGYGDSPYQSFSAFAGNPLLISPEILVRRGYLKPSDLANAPDFPVDRVDFGWVVPFKWDLLRNAFQRFRLTPAYEHFTGSNRAWLDPFARFMALKKANGGHAWTEWTTDRADEEEIEFQKFCQFEFFEEWRELKSYCARHGIRIFGDTPIYVAHDSADVWANRELFELREDGRPLRVAGVPPDYFSATGQLWGNPIYRWDRLAETGYRWWIDRLRMTLQTVDMIRLDHFRGFEAFWAVPGGDDTAVNGEWVKGPGAAIFAAAEKELGELPIVAENLGVITPEVESLREQFGFPGMAVLQFAFGTDPQAPTFRPHNFPRELAAYTGTHDNDTTIGWWTGVGVSTRSAGDIERERAFTKAYLNTDGHEMHWDFIRTILESVADIAVVPLQDVLGLGSEARMNTPAVTSGNWGWRFREEALTLEIRTRLQRLTNLYDR
ncbi:MAG TPA: 4-alpha-glucanotransferase [Bryobacteraceae bacterium]|nr:4-alpha-glucanotransferase [Bryobacteraceae bacterium]